MVEKEIVNKVAESGLLQFDLEELFQPGERELFDLKDWLFEELILKEKDFREKAKNHIWTQYHNKFVAITCTVDAVIPVWAYMLVASHLHPIARKTVMGNLQKLEEELFRGQILQLDPEKFRGQRVVLKGCSDNVPDSAYVDITNFLAPVVRSIMYGEPCSTVPVYKAKHS